MLCCTMSVIVYAEITMVRAYNEARTATVLAQNNLPAGELTFIGRKAPSAIRDAAKGPEGYIFKSSS
jgi:hypothetical protein